MAFVSKSNLPEDEQNQFGQKGQTSVNPLPPQTGGSAGAGAAGGAAPGQATSTQFGSNAAKLSDYLKVNAPQIQQFGQRISQNLGDQYNQAKGAVDTGYSNFNNDINQGWSPNQEKINQAETNPTEFVKNPEDVNNFKSWYSGQYKGPENFEGSSTYSDINNQVNKAVENASLVNTAPGLKSYVNNFMRSAPSGQFTPGMDTLDNMLMQKSPEVYQSIKQAAAPFQGLNDYLGQKSQAANQNVASAKQQALDTSQTLQNKFTGDQGLIPNFQKQIESQVQGARQDATTRGQRANDLIKNIGKVDPKTVTDQDLADLGMSRKDFESFNNTMKAATSGYANPFNPADVIYKTDYNPGQFGTMLNPEAQIGNANVATPEQYQQMAALEQLSGTSYPGILNQQNLGQAGTANKDIYDFQSSPALSQSQDVLKGEDQKLISTWTNRLDVSPEALRDRMIQQYTGVDNRNIDPVQDRPIIDALTRLGYLKDNQLTATPINIGRNSQGVF